MIASAGPLLDAAEGARRVSAAGGGAFWLSSPVSGPRELVGGAPAAVVTGHAVADLETLEQAWRRARAAWSAAGPPGAGVPVAVGWLSYELGRRLVGLAPDPRWIGPLFQFQFPDAVWVRSGGDSVVLARDGGAAGRLTAVLAQPVSPAPVPALGPLIAVDEDAAFLDGVRRILAYEAAGDVYQVNLSRRLAAAWPEADPVYLAIALRRRAPAPHAAFIATPGGPVVIGNSPERFLSLGTDGVLETRPIKGTRARGATPEADRAAVDDLRASPKDRAEHVMIVDLERNDLGRVCRPGTIEVAALAEVLALPTVHHLESTVRGLLRPGVGLPALLAATFPGGSITGAPKRRAMEIIDELELGPRGVYTGATGWLGAAGDLDLAVAIRTATVAAGRLELSVGGGIVFDSTPDGELAETEVKARAFARLASGAPPR